MKIESIAILQKHEKNDYSLINLDLTQEQEERLQKFLDEVCQQSGSTRGATNDIVEEVKDTLNYFDMI